MFHYIDGNFLLQKGTPTMRRIVSLLLSALMLLSLTALFAGCGSKEGNYLRVGMECAYAPYNWSQKTDANGAVQIADSSNYAYGYDVIVAKKIAAELGYDGVLVYQIDWDTLPLAVNAGKVDCVIAGQSITAERAEQVDFTVPYYYASIVSLVKADGQYANAKSISDFAGARAISQINTVWNDTCIPQIPNVNHLTPAETSGAMIVNLTSGNADLVVTDLPTAMAAVAVYPELKLVAFTGTDGDFQVSDEEINIGISCKKGNTELVEKINSVLSKMTVDDFEDMMDEAIRVQPLNQN